MHNDRSFLRPSAIDISRLPDPAILEPISHQKLQDEFISRFLSTWQEAQQEQPNLRTYDVENLQTDPVIIASQSYSGLRLRDRQRVNETVKAVLATFAEGTDLDHVVARQNIMRLAGEDDFALLRRYLLSFDRASAGSAARYKFEAFTAVPDLLDVEVNGQAIHNRVGDIDVVAYFPDLEEDVKALKLDQYRKAVLNNEIWPEGRSIAALEAEIVYFDIPLSIQAPIGLDKDILRAETVDALKQAATRREFIGAVLPLDYITGAAYGQNTIDVIPDASLKDIITNRYQVPKLRNFSVEVELV